MFGWFSSSKCPLETWEKAWTERRMRWLAHQFGIERLKQATVVLPTEEFFPDPFDSSIDSARLLFRRLCGYMEVDPERVELCFRSDEQMPDAVGLYEEKRPSRKAAALFRKPRISVALSQLDDAARLAATMIHELAHERLIGGGLLSSSATDHEWVTDLLPVVLGTAIFQANSTVHDASGYVGGWSWWSMSRQGYLPSRIYGYALALFAFLRGETKPRWAQYLRSDAAQPLQAGLHHLRAGGHSFFHPDTIGDKMPPLTVEQAAERLRDPEPGVRVATLWDMIEQELCQPELLAMVQDCLTDRDGDVQAEAARALGHFGKQAEPALPALIAALWRNSDAVSALAARALGHIGQRAELIVPELTAYLRRARNADAIQNAAVSLAIFGNSAANAVPAVLGQLESALRECDHTLCWHLLMALARAAPDARQRLQQHFQHDAELCRLGLDILEEVETAQPPPPADKAIASGGLGL